MEFDISGTKLSTSFSGLYPELGVGPNPVGRTPITYRPFSTIIFKTLDLKRIKI